MGSANTFCGTDVEQILRVGLKAQHDNPGELALKQMIELLHAFACIKRCFSMN
jgi:hypothetical protein